MNKKRGLLYLAEQCLSSRPLKSHFGVSIVNDPVEERNKLFNKVPIKKQPKRFCPFPHRSLEVKCCC